MLQGLYIISNSEIMMFECGNRRERRRYKCDDVSYHNYGQVLRNEVKLQS